MKFEDLTIKDKVLVAIGDIKIADSIYDIRHNLINAHNTRLTNKQISNAIHNLIKDRYVYRVGCSMRLFDPGVARCSNIMRCLAANKQLSDYPHINEPEDWVTIALKLAGFAQQFANGANANDDSLQKIKKLEDELDAKNAKLDEYIATNASLDHQRSELSKKVYELQQKVDSLRDSLSNALADLNAKNKKVEHLENSIDKLAANLVTMRNWALDMKNGAN